MMLPAAAIYARVSTEDQGRGFSISTQIEACQKLADQEGYSVPESHLLIDEGISGTTMERPGLRRLRELVNTKAIAAVIVYDPDRLSRKLGHQLVLFESAPMPTCYFSIRHRCARFGRLSILVRPATACSRAGKCMASPG